LITRHTVLLLSLSPWLDSSIGLSCTGTSSYCVSWNRYCNLSSACYALIDAWHEKHPFLSFSVSCLLCSDNFCALKSLLSSDTSQNKHHRFTTSHQTIDQSPWWPFPRLFSSGSLSTRQPHSAWRHILLRNFFLLLQPH